jgi:hypothetical protein
MDIERTLLEMWDVTAQYLTKVVSLNPSLRGMMLGYLAERKLHDIFELDQRVSDLRKDDDHDRRRKGDLVVTYKGFEFKIEVKSLQTNSVEIYDESTPLMIGSGTWVKKMIKQNARWVENEKYKQIWEQRRLEARYRGFVQCDASDKRAIQLPNGTKFLTTNLLVGEFDILAAGLFAFREYWDFGFALNSKLPRSSHRNYPPEIHEHLLKTLIPVTWPLEQIFTSDPFILLDHLVEQRLQTK